MAFEGIKFAPTSHGCCLYQSFAFCWDQRSTGVPAPCAHAESETANETQSREFLKTIALPFMAKLLAFPICIANAHQLLFGLFALFLIAKLPIRLGQQEVGLF